MSLITLQIALIDDDRNSIQSLVSEIDRKTENEAYRQAGEHFGFQTAEWSGRRIAYQGDLARVFGYSDPSGLRKLAERYDLEALQMGWFGQNVLTKIRATFNLEVKTSRAIFFTWPTFLVAGMASSNVQAEKVKRYLLECERAARVGGGLLASGKHEREARQDSFRRAATIARIDGMKNPTLQRLALTEIGIDPAIPTLPGNQGDLFKTAGN